MIIILPKIKYILLSSNEAKLHTSRKSKANSIYPQIFRDHNQWRMTLMSVKTKLLCSVLLQELFKFIYIIYGILDFSRWMQYILLVKLYSFNICIHIKKCDICLYVVVVRWQQDKNGKEAREETEGKSGSGHRGI